MIHPMLGEAWLAMGANRLRTALTMLGMVIGVGAVVIMMAIGQGAQYAVQQTISTMGSNLFIVLSGVFHGGRCAQRLGRCTDAERCRRPGHCRTRWRGQRSANPSGVAATGLWLAKLEFAGHRHNAGIPRMRGPGTSSTAPDSVIPTCARRRGWRSSARPWPKTCSATTNPGRQDHAHPAEPLLRHRRAWQQGTEPRRPRSGRHP